MPISEKLYQGPVIGFGMSGQAGSSFVQLSILHQLKKQARSEGRDLGVIYAMDADVCPPVTDMIRRTADTLGIDIVHISERSLGDHRRAVDHSSFHWYGPRPDLTPVVLEEAALFRQYQPSMISGFISPTLAYSRQIYEKETGKTLPYLGILFTLTAGPGRFGVPVNFFPSWFARPAAFLARERPFLDRVSRGVYRLKLCSATRYLWRGISRKWSGPPLEKISFDEALHGDLAIIFSSPVYSVPRAEDTRFVGYTNPHLALSAQQMSKQKAIVARLEEWQADGNRTLFISMGSTGHEFYSVLKALKPLLLSPEKRIRVVASTTLIAGTEGGKLLNDLEKQGLAVFSDWMRLEEILPRVDLLITHGGVGSLENGLRWGIPTIVSAPQQIEQGFNGMALKHAGLGEVVWGHQVEGRLPMVCLDMLSRSRQLRQACADYRDQNPACYDLSRQRVELVESCNEAVMIRERRMNK